MLQVLMRLTLAERLESLSFNRVASAPVATSSWIVDPSSGLHHCRLRLPRCRRRAARASQAPV